MKKMRSFALRYHTSNHVVLECRLRSRRPRQLQALSLQAGQVIDRMTIISPFAHGARGDSSGSLRRSGIGSRRLNRGAAYRSRTPGRGDLRSRGGWQSRDPGGSLGCCARLPRPRSGHGVASMPVVHPETAARRASKSGDFRRLLHLFSLLLLLFRFRFLFLFLFLLLFLRFLFLLLVRRLPPCPLRSRP